MIKLPFTVVVDFDGVIVEEAYPKIGEPVFAAIESIQTLYNMGAKIIIWTCREKIPAWQAIKYIKKNRIPFHAFNDNIQERVDFYGAESRKVSGDIYVDDKNLGGFPGWPEAMMTIMNMMKKY